MEFHSSNLKDFSRKFGGKSLRSFSVSFQEHPVVTQTPGLPEDCLMLQKWRLSVNNHLLVTASSNPDYLLTRAAILNTPFVSHIAQKKAIRQATLTNQTKTAM